MSKPIVAGGSDQAIRICEILGVRADRCSEIQIVIKPNEHVHALATMNIHDEQADELITVLQRHEWVEA